MQNNQTIPLLRTESPRTFRRTLVASLLAHTFASTSGACKRAPSGCFLSFVLNMSTRSQQAKIAQAAAAAAATAAKSKANNKGKRAVPAQSDGIGALNEIDSNSAPASKKSKGVFLTFSHITSQPETFSPG
jgi:hypothetical protein